MKVAIPGEVLATAEEYLPGEGVVEIEGNLIATVHGIVEIDKELRINVKRIAEWPEIRDGVEVYGIVTDILDEFVIVQIVSVDEMDREIVGGDTTGIIHISKISKQFVDKIGKFYRIGDIIRAKVLRAKPSIRLGTIGRRYGVVLARCMKCRRPLEFIAGKLYCPHCKRIETRKIAYDYRKVEWSKWKRNWK